MVPKLPFSLSLIKEIRKKNENSTTFSKTGCPVKFRPRHRYTYILTAYGYDIEVFCQKYLSHFLIILSLVVVIDADFYIVGAICFLVVFEHIS